MTNSLRRLVARSSIRPRREAEFEWVCTVGVGVGMRTAITQTADVPRACVITPYQCRGGTWRLKVWWFSRASVDAPT